MVNAYNATKENIDHNIKTAKFGEEFIIFTVFVIGVVLTSANLISLYTNYITFGLNLGEKTFHLLLIGISILLVITSLYLLKNKQP